MWRLKKIKLCRTRILKYKVLVIFDIERNYSRICCCDQEEPNPHNRFFARNTFSWWSYIKLEATFERVIRTVRVLGTSLKHSQRHDKGIYRTEYAHDLCIKVISARVNHSYLWKSATLSSLVLIVLGGLTKRYRNPAFTTIAMITETWHWILGAAAESEFLWPKSYPTGIVWPRA